MNSTTESITATINTQLNQAKTRQSGFKYLLEYLSIIPNESLNQYMNLWLSKATHELENVNNNNQYLNEICRTIGALITAAREVAELKKLVAVQYVKQIINIIANFQRNKRTGGIFYLLSVLLYHYPESCARLQDSLTKIIIPLIDSDNEVLVRSAAKNYALLSRAIVRSFKPSVSKPNYTGYMYNEYLICNTLHVIMDELFSDSADADKNSTLEVLDLPTISQEDVLEHFQCVERRVNNLCIFLSTMLRTIIQKTSVSTTDILHLLSRCFDLTLQSNSDSVREQHLQEILLRMFISFSSVLNALIEGFGVDLLPNAIPIFQLILQIFTWTDKVSKKELNRDVFKLVTNIRTIAYKLLSSWLKFSGPASPIEHIAEKVLVYILQDAIPKKNSVVLVAQNPLHMSARAIKKFKASYNIEPKDESENDRLFKADPNMFPDLCVESLILLQRITSKANYLLKPHFYETIEEDIIPALYYLYTNIQLNYFSKYSKCRLELVRTLRSLLVTPHPSKSMPLANSIEIFQMARNDHCPEIAEEAELALNILEKIGHPAAPTLFLPLASNSSNQLKRNAESMSDELNSLPHKQQKVIPLLEIIDSDKAISLESNSAEEKMVDKDNPIDMNNSQISITQQETESDSSSTSYIQTLTHKKPDSDVSSQNSSQQMLIQKEDNDDLSLSVSQQKEAESDSSQSSCPQVLTQKKPDSDSSQSSYLQVLTQKKVDSDFSEKSSSNLSQINVDIEIKNVELELEIDDSKCKINAESKEDENVDEELQNGTELENVDQNSESSSNSGYLTLKFSNKKNSNSDNDEDVTEIMQLFYNVPNST